MNYGLTVQSAGVRRRCRGWLAVHMVPGQLPPAWCRQRRAAGQTPSSSLYSSDQRHCVLSFGHLDEALWQSRWMLLLLCSSKIQGEHQHQAPRISRGFYYCFFKRKTKPFLYVKKLVCSYSEQTQSNCVRESPGSQSLRLTTEDQRTNTNAVDNVTLHRLGLKSSANLFRARK